MSFDVDNTMQIANCFASETGMILSEASDSFYRILSRSPINSFRSSEIEEVRQYASESINELTKYADKKRKELEKIIDNCDLFTNLVHQYANCAMNVWRYQAAANHFFDARRRADERINKLKRQRDYLKREKESMIGFKKKILSDFSILKGNEELIDELGGDLSSTNDKFVLHQYKSLCESNKQVAELIDLINYQNMQFSNLISRIKSSIDKEYSLKNSLYSACVPYLEQLKSANGEKNYIRKTIKRRITQMNVQSQNAIGQGVKELVGVAERGDSVELLLDRIDEFVSSVMWRLANNAGRIK